jgi:putative transposase
MRLMGIEAIYPKQGQASRLPATGSLKGMGINRPDMVWCSDITYIPLRHGLMYLVAVMDWHSRKVIWWRISNTLDTGFCVFALENAIVHYGRPEIFNTDQSSQFTSEAFTIKRRQNQHERLRPMDGQYFH